MVDLQKMRLRLGTPRFTLGQPVATDEGQGLVIGVKYRALNTLEYLVQIIEEEDEEISETFALWYDESALIEAQARSRSGPEGQSPRPGRS